MKNSVYETSGKCTSRWSYREMVIIKTVITLYFFLSAFALFSQGEWAQNFRPDESFEFHKIDTVFLGEAVESIKYVNQNNHVSFYVSRHFGDGEIETGYLKNGLNYGLWRRHNRRGKVIRSLDFDTLTIQEDDIVKISEANGFDLEDYEIDFHFDDYRGDDSLKHHWTITKEFYEFVNWWRISGISVDAVSGKESFYEVEIHEHPVLPNYDTPPSFNGLYRSLDEFIATNSRFAISEKHNSENAVYVSFKVDVDGAIKDIRTGRANTGAFKREARRLVEIMPNWFPAQRNGEAVECAHHWIRINFE